MANEQCELNPSSKSNTVQQPQTAKATAEHHPEDIPLRANAQIVTEQGRSASQAIEKDEELEGDTIVVEQPGFKVTASASARSYFDTVENGTPVEVNEQDYESDSTLTSLGGTPDLASDPTTSAAPVPRAAPPVPAVPIAPVAPVPKADPKWLRYSNQGGCPHGMIKHLWIHPKTMPFPEPCNICISANERAAFHEHMVQQRKGWMKKVQSSQYNRVPGDRFYVERRYMGCGHGQGWQLRIVQDKPEGYEIEEDVPVSGSEDDETRKRKKRLDGRQARKKAAGQVRMKGKA